MLASKQVRLRPVKRPFGCVMPRNASKVVQSRPKQCNTIRGHAGAYQGASTVEVGASSELPLQADILYTNIDGFTPRFGQSLQPTPHQTSIDKTVGLGTHEVGGRSTTLGSIACAGRASWGRTGLCLRLH